MRVLDYLSVGLRTIGRQPLRSLLTVSALAISTSILVILLAISLGVQNTIESGLGFTRSLNSLVVTPNQNISPSLIGGSVQVANESATRIDDTAVEVLHSLPHVSSVQPTAGLWELKQFTVEGIPKTFVAQASGTTQMTNLQVGRSFSGEAHEVVIGWAYARELGFSETNIQELLGKTITFTTQDGYRGEGAVIPTNKSSRQQHEQFSKTPATLTAAIVGVSKQGAGDNQVFLPMQWARKIKTVSTYNAQGAIEQVDQIEKSGYTSVVLQAENDTFIKSVSKSVMELGYGSTSAQEQIERITSLTTIMWGLFGAIALVSLITACLGIANTMLTTISEQRYTIGVWRAVGARRRTIALQFIVQAGILGILGGILGSALGWIACRSIGKYVANLLSQQNLPVVDIVQVTPLLLVGCVFVALFFAVGSGLYPAWRASRQDPSEALSGSQ